MTLSKTIISHFSVKHVRAKEPLKALLEPAWKVRFVLFFKMHGTQPQLVEPVE